MSNVRRHLEPLSLIGKMIESVLVAPCYEVHSAWVNELTTPLATSLAFLRLSEEAFVEITPCEVTVDPHKYPSLGLSMRECVLAEVRNVIRVEASALAAHPPQLAGLAPFRIRSVEVSDPMREGVTSEIRLEGSGSVFVLFRHIFPPMTLGVACGLAR